MSQLLEGGEVLDLGVVQVQRGQLSQTLEGGETVNGKSRKFELDEGLLNFCELRRWDARSSSVE